MSYVRLIPKHVLMTTRLNLPAVGTQTDIHICVQTHTHTHTQNYLASELVTPANFTSLSGILSQKHLSMI